MVFVAVLLPRAADLGAAVSVEIKLGRVNSPLPLACHFSATAVRNADGTTSLHRDLRFAPVTTPRFVLAVGQIEGVGKRTRARA